MWVVAAGSSFKKKTANNNFAELTAKSEYIFLLSRYFFCQTYDTIFL